MARCMLFFGLIAPPVGGVIMFLLMTFGSGELVEIGRLEADDMLGMLALIGAFSYAFGFLPACLVGAIAGIVHPVFADCGGFCCYARYYPPLLLVC